MEPAAPATLQIEEMKSYDLPAIACVLRDRNERTGPLLAFLTHWAERPEAPRSVFNLVVSAIRLNRRSHLPWWVPSYLIRRLLDSMPCVQITLTGAATRRASPPPDPARSH